MGLKHATPELWHSLLLASVPSPLISATPSASLPPQLPSNNSFVKGTFGPAQSLHISIGQAMVYSFIDTFLNITSLSNIPMTS